MIFGIGYLGYNGRDLVAAKLQNKILARENGIKTLTYKAWEHMLGRCYHEKTQQANAKTYIDCSVDESWHNFQNFAEWFNKRYKPGYQLDKDLLIKGNRIYSENTCCLIPEEINKALETSKAKRKEGIPLGVTIIVTNNGTEVIYARYIRKYLGTFSDINSAWLAYKQEKENYLKLLAEKYKNEIEENVYQALINYKVEITD